MASLHILVLSAIATVARKFVTCKHILMFWLLVAASACFLSYTAAVAAMFAALFAVLASMEQPPGPLVAHRGGLDVLFGRAYRASTITPDQPANNNVSVATHKGRAVVAYRKAETHFASASAQIIVASSDNLRDWDIVWTYTTGKDDLREVLLWEFRGRLFLYFASLAPYEKGFSPRGMHWTATSDLKSWSEPVAMGRATEITWDVKVREEGSAHAVYKVGYVGNHYAADAVCTVLFEKSNDGENWRPLGKDLAVYVGGVSEVSFAFTAAGDLVAIGRNEDGDHTGFGSQLFFAPKDDLGSWIPLKVSIPYRFDSPRMMLMQGEVVLFARYAKENYNAAPAWFPMGIRRMINLVYYSALPKSAAVYRLNCPDASGTWPSDPIELVRLFEKCYGDTGFFSLAKFDNSDEWVVANYASTSCHSHASWFYGQLFPTDVYVSRCLPVHR